jgi:hypothetical protein
VPENGTGAFQVTCSSHFTTRARDPGAGSRQAFRQGNGGRRARPRARSRPLSRSARTQRGRQDHCRQHAGGNAATGRGRDRGARPALAGRRQRDPRADRRAAPGDRTHRQTYRARAASGLSQLLSRRTYARRSDRARRARGKDRLAVPHTVRRPEAAPRARLRARQQAAATVPRRANDRARSSRPAAGMGDHPAVPVRRRHRAAHDALHGRGRVALRRGDGHRSWTRQSVAAVPPS